MRMRIGKKILCGVALGVLFSITLAFDHPLAEGAKEQGVWVYFSEDAKHACRPHGPRLSESSFFLDELRDLYICVIWYDLAGTYVQQLAFYLPSGHLYQILTTPFATPGTSGPAQVDVDGRLVEVQEGRWVGKEQTGVLTVLPVAGTYITQRSLVGTWRVDVSLNGQPVRQLPLTLKNRE